VALSNVDSLFRKDARSALQVIASAARVTNLASLNATASAFVLEPESVVEASKINGCLLTGTNVEVRSSALSSSARRPN